MSAGQKFKVTVSSMDDRDRLVVLIQRFGFVTVDPEQLEREADEDGNYEIEGTTAFPEGAGNPLQNIVENEFSDAKFQWTD